MRLVFRTLTIACVFAMSCEAQVRLTMPEARKNPISAAPVIRLDSAAVAEHPDWNVHVPSPAVPVMIVVDKEGRVRSATPLRSNSLNDRAVELAKALQFAPFLKKGRPIEIQYLEFVRIYPPERSPVNHVPFPEWNTGEPLEFWLSRGPCFGSCPIYEVHVTGDGVVSFVGRRPVVGVKGAPDNGLMGEWRGRATPEAIQALLDSFRKADFFSLDERYEWNWSGLSTATVGITIGTKSKTVVDYAGVQVGMPAIVSDLEKEIDGIMNSAKPSGLARP
jgi:hypothetical protein